MAPLKPRVASDTYAVAEANHADQSTAAKREQTAWNGEDLLNILLRSHATMSK